MTGLLVSVRSVVEVEIALAGGAALIDVKEPSRGALGRAEDATIAAIARLAAGRRPVSAALGELTDRGDLPVGADLTYVKWGLAGCIRHDWRTALSVRLQQSRPQTVIVAYGDWRCAAAPPVDEVVSFACEKPGNVLLIDTHCKDAARLSLGRRPTLLDWLSFGDVIAICQRCREAGVRCALAGSLGPTEIEILLPAKPDWFAVRGAVCEDNVRGGAISLARVRTLTEQISSARPQPARFAG